MNGFPRRLTPNLKTAARGRIIVKTPREITLMMQASEISALALQLAGEMINPGVTTEDINKAIGEFINKKGGKPSFYGLYGFKWNACISINSELIHGIPSKKRYLNEGDIVTVDVGAFKDGYHGDNSATFACGMISDKARKIMNVGEQALQLAIAQCYSGNRIGDIGNAVQSCCEGAGYFIPEDYHGHGIGRDLHENPNVFNVGEQGRGQRLTPGMTIAIEPMLNETTKEVRILKDGWTVIEGNGNLSAHFEHTVLITSGEPIVMTKL
jgi:methionyl aminopeptidase